jgi:hypothetical protein
MKNKYFLTLALAFASIGLFAQTTVWIAEGAPAKWEVVENWRDGLYPDETVKTVFNVPASADCLIDIDTAVVKHLVMGDNTPNGGAIIIKDGGVLTTDTLGPWSAVGYNEAAELIIEAGGVLNSGHRFHIGLVEPKGPAAAILEVAGTLNVKNIFSVNPGGFADWTAEAYITTGGVINTPNFLIGDGGMLDVTGGMLIIGRDLKDALTAYVTDGKLTAEGGSEEPTIEWQITGSGEEADTATIVKSSTTVGVFDNKVAKKASIGVYPNPARDVVYFKDNVVDDVKIYSITGEIVLRRSNVAEVSIESLKPGYYIIKSEANHRTYVDKLLVK